MFLIIYMLDYQHVDQQELQMSGGEFPIRRANSVLFFGSMGSAQCLG